MEIDHRVAEAWRLEQPYAHRMREDLRMGALVSYVGNKDIPLLRLYRYQEAFAFRFVDEGLTRFGVSRTKEAPHPAVRELVDFLRARGKALNNPRIPDMLTGYFVDMLNI
ncbi:MAG: hypothetical protein RML46_02265 [Anaerolineae bacterium]|nr:hypothetical protein [Anaerolineae bacterium]